MSNPAEMDEMKGRLMALEAFVGAMVNALPQPERERLLNSIEGGLLRRPESIRKGSTLLMGRIRHGLPMP